MANLPISLTIDRENPQNHAKTMKSVALSDIRGGDVKSWAGTGES
jgi:hypothetical protein